MHKGGAEDGREDELERATERMVERSPGPYTGSGREREDTSVTLYEQVGGSAGVRAIADVLYDRLLRDPLLADVFNGVDVRRLRAHQTDFLAWVLGGTDEYEGRDLERAHQRLAVTDESFTRFIEIVDSVLTDIGLDQDEAGQVVGVLEQRRSQVVGTGAGD